MKLRLNWKMPLFPDITLCVCVFCYCCFPLLSLLQACEKTNSHNSTSCPGKIPGGLGTQRVAVLLRCLLIVVDFDFCRGIVTPRSSPVSLSTEVERISDFSSFPFCLLEQDVLGFCLAPFVGDFFLPPVFISEEQECWCLCCDSYILQTQYLSVERGSVSSSRIVLLLSEETCRACDSHVRESCLQQAGRFPLSLCRLCQPPVPFAEDGNSIDLLFQVSGCDLWQRTYCTVFKMVCDIIGKTK